MSPRLWLLVILVGVGAFAPSRADARGAETCARGFLATATTARPESEPQVAGLHQGFPACGYESASGYSQAAETITSGGTADAFQYQLLKQDLLSQQASSVFTDSGSLTQEAINGSKQLIAPEDLGNPAIPDGFAKFTTVPVNGPSGPFTVRFYMNPQTGEVFQGVDYKTILLGPK